MSAARRSARDDQMNHLRRAVPYTTSSGVQIGLTYIPKPQPLTADQERMQAALLDSRTARPVSLLQRLFGPVWRWL